MYYYMRKKIRTGCLQSIDPRHFYNNFRKFQFYKWKSKKYRMKLSNSTSMKGNFKETAEDIMEEKLRVNTFSSTLCTMTNENTTTAYNNHWKWNAWLKFHMKLSSVILTTTNYVRIYEQNCTYSVHMKTQQICKC